VLQRPLVNLIEDIREDAKIWKLSVKYSKDVIALLGRRDGIVLNPKKQLFVST